MILYLQTRGFGFRLKCPVTNEYGEEEYYVEHSFYSSCSIFSGSERYHDISIRNMALEEAVRLERSNRNAVKTSVYVGDKKITEVERNIFSLRICYAFPGLGWEMTVGLDGRRVIKKGDTYIATVEFKGTQGPGYEMDILNPKNAELVIAAVVAMHIIEEKVAQRHHQRNRYHRYRHHH